MVHTVTVSDEVFDKFVKIAHEAGDSYPTIFDQLLTRPGVNAGAVTPGGKVSADQALSQSQQSVAPAPSGQIDIDHAIKVAKLESLELDNAFKKMRNAKVGAGKPVPGTWENGVWTPKEQGPFYCYDGECERSFPLHAEDRDNHMRTSHGWGPEQFANVRSMSA